MTYKFTKQDYWDLGTETERWFWNCIKENSEIISKIGEIELEATKQRDMIAHSHDGITTYLDVKFLKERYRREGWIEARSWGKVTGIFGLAIENYKDPNVRCFIVVLHCGMWHIIDAKAILTLYKKGEVPLHEFTMWEGDGQKNKKKNFQINGFSDSRCLISEGKCNTALWDPITPIGKKIRIEEWCKGVWATK